MSNRPSTACKMCGEPECDDWMYHCDLVPAEQAICGKCKVDFGKRVAESMLDDTRWIEDLIKVKDGLG